MTISSRRQPGVAARIVGAVEAIVADRLAGERWRADDDDRQMVGRLRRTELVALAFQDLAGVRRQREVLDVGQVRQPLLVEARHVDGFLRVHAVVDGVDHGLQHGGDDAAAAGRAHHDHRLAVLGDDGRAHRGQRTLAGGDGVGLALHQAVQVGHADLGGEVVHFVVQKHAGLGRRHPGAEPVVQRVGHRHRVAVLVGDRVVRGVAALMRRDARLDVLGHAGLVRVDHGADLGRVILVEQVIERVLHEVRIAEIAVAVDVGVAHGFDLVVHGLRRVVAQLLERIAFQDVEDLADDHAARARRRRGDDVVAAVVAFDRCQLARLVLVEVRLRDQAFAGLARCHDGAADPALVEAVGAPLADLAQRLGEVILHQLLAHLVRLAVVEEDGGRRGVLLEILGRGEQHVDVALVEREAVLGQLDRRRDQFRALHGAVLLPGVFHARNGAGHADGEVPLGGQALDDVAVLVEVHVGGGALGRRLAEIEEGLAAVGKLDGHEAAAAEIAGRRIDHGERIADRHRRVDRVAAALEHIHAHHRGQVLGGNHHPVFGGDRRHGRRAAGREGRDADRRIAATIHRTPVLGFCMGASRKRRPSQPRLLLKTYVYQGARPRTMGSSLFGEQHRWAMRELCEMITKKGDRSDLGRSNRSRREVLTRSMIVSRSDRRVQLRTAEKIVLLCRKAWRVVQPPQHVPVLRSCWLQSNVGMALQARHPQITGG